MKVIGINGSPRKGGNTELMIRRAFEQLEAEGIETELVQVGGKPIAGCKACGACMKNQNQRCIVDSDMINELVQNINDADGIILGSPTYFADVTTEMKAFIDRAGMVARANKNLFRRKVGAAVTAVRRGGSIHAFDTMNHWFQIGEMIIVGSSYWNLGFGPQKGDVVNDGEGMDTMDTLGKNMAWLLKKLG